MEFTRARIIERFTDSPEQVMQDEIMESNKLGIKISLNYLSSFSRHEHRSFSSIAIDE